MNVYSINLTDNISGKINSNINSELNKIFDHNIIRVGDGYNLQISKYPFWCVKKGKNGCIKSIVSKMKPGDILWFLTSKKYGGKIIGMSEYSKFYDKNDELLIQINTTSNKEQN